MSTADLEELAAECEKTKPEDGRAMTRTERAGFEAWQKKALAHEAAKGAGSLTLVFPRELAERIGQLAKRRHTTVKKLVQDAVYQLVA